MGTSSSRKWDDDNGHGTHVAGIIAARNNTIGVIGVAPDAELYAVKVLNSYGGGSISDVIEGIDWAVQNNMDIISMSLGTDTYSQVFADASATIQVFFLSRPQATVETGISAQMMSSNVAPAWSADDGEVELAAPFVMLCQYYN